jgi:hypothetical protein
MGISFLIEAMQKFPSQGIKVLALNSGIALFAVDFYYSYRNVIREVYVIDGFVQLIFISLWLFRMLAKNRLF